MVPSGAVKVFEEAEDVTVFVPQERVPPGARASHPHSWFVLQAESDLASVGFLARITEKLAAAGISTNAVSAYYHDHLFVSHARAAEALLEELSRSA